MIKKYRYWQNDGLWLGYLEEYPDYLTQGKTIEELTENLKDISRLKICRERESNPHGIAPTGF